ncbi:hypothetical protein [Leptospira sp. 'Mane']|uniref:hypothetical protein n=1 Tax=Leptospira sp. 'Mane' TaxID=3387407 RepID=UPI00398AE0F3
MNFEPEWIFHKNKQIRFIDYRNLNEEEMIERLRTSMSDYQSITEKILCLIDYSNSFISSKYFNILLSEGAAEIRKEKIEKTALIGINLAKLAYLDIYKTLTMDQRIRVFERKEDALDWLVD